MKFFQVEFSKDYNTNPIVYESLLKSIPDEVEESLIKVMHFHLDNEESMIKNYSNIASEIDEGVQKCYNIRLGCFTEWNGKYTLEEEYDTAKDMLKDMMLLDFDEIKDCKFVAYLEIELTEPDKGKWIC